MSQRGERGEPSRKSHFLEKGDWADCWGAGRFVPIDDQFYGLLRVADHAARSIVGRKRFPFLIPVEGA
jgi:hypothetical protein